MRFGHRLLGFFAALGAAGLAAAAPACAGGSTTETGGSGGSASTSSSTSASSGATTTTTAMTGGAGGMGGLGGGPGGGCVASNDVVLAVSHLYFGDTNWDDTANTTTGWQNFGLDIDGLSSTGTSTDTCKAAFGGATDTAFPDGPGGLDNSFGKNVLPVFLASIPSLSAQANLAIYNGDFSILIRMEGLGAGPDQSGIAAKVYNGAVLDVTPNWDGHDCWPVQPGSLDVATDIDSAKTSFPASTLTANHWDSVGKGDLTLQLQVLNFQGHVTIHHARVVMDLDADHQGTQHGIISGVLDTEELVSTINQLMGQFDPSQCGGVLQQQIDLKIRQASDILKDGTQDPTKSCDGLSIGLGFKASRMQFGAIGNPLNPDPMPCP